MNSKVYMIIKLWVFMLECTLYKSYIGATRGIMLLLRMKYIETIHNITVTCLLFLMNTYMKY